MTKPKGTAQEAGAIDFNLKRAADCAFDSDNINHDTVQKVKKPTVFRPRNSTICNAEFQPSSARSLSCNNCTASTSKEYEGDSMDLTEGSQEPLDELKGEIKRLNQLLRSKDLNIQELQEINST